MKEKSNYLSKAFKKAITPFIRQLIQEEIMGFARLKPATVKAVSGTYPNQTANVELGVDKGSGTTINNLRNRSIASVSVNDEVYIILPQGKSLTNAWIITKK